MAPRAREMLLLAVMSLLYLKLPAYLYITSPAEGTIHL